MWVGMIGAVISSDSAGHEKLLLPVTGGRYVLNGLDCQDQAGQNDFEDRESRTPGSFILVSGSEALFLLVCPALHTYTHYPISEKKNFAELMSLEELAILVYYVLVEHRYLQRGVCGWRGFHHLSDHIYFMSLSCNLKEEVAIAYGASTAVVMKPVTVLGEEGAEQDVGESRGPTRKTGP